MGSVCILKLCQHFKRCPKQDKNIRLHPFPTALQLRNVWEKWVFEKNELITKISDKSHGLCSSHFEEDCFCPGHFRLKPDAKPSIAPDMTAEYAFNCGLISKQEDFPEFLAQVKSPVASGGQDGGCPLRANKLPLQDDNARFQIHKRKRRKLNNENSQLVPEEDLLKHSTPSIRAEAYQTSRDFGESSDTDSSSISGDDFSANESDIDTYVRSLDTSKDMDADPSMENASLEEPGSSLNDANQSKENDNAEANAAQGTPFTPSMRRKKRVAYLGDITPSKLETPRSKLKVLSVIQKVQSQSRLDRQSMRRRMLRAQKKIDDLKSLVNHLTKTNAVPLELAEVLKRNFEGPTAALLNSVINGSKSGRKGGLYEPIVRKFAMTLNFHSPSAYRYVRTKLLGNNLPHPRTLSKWYSSVDARPGFTEESKQAIKVQADIMKRNGHTLRIALCHDDMALRQQVTYTTDGCVVGFAYDGYTAFAETDDCSLAKQAWVIMATAINGSWKLPLGYFFISSMDANVGSNLLKRCLEWLHDTGAVVDSMTFDGLLSNISTAQCLGAHLQPGRNWQPYCPHPVRAKPGEFQMPPIHVLLDAAHMVKLWRNVFGSDAQLEDSQGRSISFEYVNKLHNLQEKERLRVGNKLTGSHVKFAQQKQKVYLATQTLSASVADAIDACRDDLHLLEFRGSEGTSHFIRMADSIFDIQNSHNRRTNNQYKKALGDDNIAAVREKFAEAREYSGLKIKGRKDRVFSPILNHRLHTGFLGFLVNMDSIEGLYDRLIVGKVLGFLPTYKLSQDHLEMFFEMIRSKGRWNNNPSTIQFISAYKRLLVNVELKYPKRGGNCWPLERVAILTVSSRSGAARAMDTADEELVRDTDHSYARSLARTGMAFSSFVGDIVEYIAGFVARTVNNQHDCADCSPALFRKTTHGLVSRKNRGGLKSPSADVLKICRKAESIIRASARDRSFLTTKRDVHVTRIFRDVVGEHPTIFRSLDEHVASQAPLNNHKFCLLKLVIKKYLIVRICWDVKKLNAQFIKQGLRATLTKSVLFQHQ